MLAEILMMITSLPIFYYYYTMYSVNEKTRYLIGLLAGAWAFLGVFLILGGIVRFSYFIILIIIVVLVYFFEKIMSYFDEEFDEDEYEEYEIEWPVDVSNTTMAFLTLIFVIVLYMAFLVAPVSPARIDDPAGFDEEEGSYKAFPDGYMYEYKKSDGTYVVVLTIRSIPITQGMLGGQLEKGNAEVEEYIKERYGEDTSIDFTSEDTLEIKGYDAVEKNFDITRSGLVGTKVGEMTLQAFYYHNDLEVIVLGYFYPPGQKAKTVGISDDLVL